MSYYDNPYEGPEEPPQCPICGSIAQHDSGCDAIVVPDFDERWVEQMGPWLISCQGHFDGPHEWLQWVKHMVPDILDSWGFPWISEVYEMLEGLVDGVADQLDPKGYTDNADFFRDEIHLALEESYERNR